MVWTFIIMIKHSDDQRNNAPCDSILADCMEGLRIITIAIYCGQHNATASIRQKWLHTCAHVNNTSRVKERIGLATAVANAQAPITSRPLPDRIASALIKALAPSAGVRQSQSSADQLN